MDQSRERRAFQPWGWDALQKWIAGLQPLLQWIQSGSVPGGWLGPGPPASPRALLGHAGQYTLLAGESSGSYLLVGREVLHSFGEFPTNWAINSGSCSLEQLWMYPFLCFGFCGCAQTTGFWMEYFELIEMRLCSFPSSCKGYSCIFFCSEQFIFCLVLG